MGLGDRTGATSETRAQTAGQATAMRDRKVARRRLGHCVDRAFRGRPELAQYRQSNYRGTGVAATCNDMNIKLAFAKEHQARLSPVGVTAAFLAKVEAEGCRSNSRAAPKKPPSPNYPPAPVPSAKPKAVCTSPSRTSTARGRRCTPGI